MGLAFRPSGRQDGCSFGRSVGVSPLAEVLQRNCPVCSPVLERRVMTTLDYILLVLLSLPPKYGDGETVDQRVRRMQVAASAVDAVTERATCSGLYKTESCKRLWIGSKKDLALLLITKAWWESRFARNVHEGNCAKWECDATKLRNGQIVHRARSVWQLQKTGLMTDAEWKEMEGAGYHATRTAAWAAARVLSRGRNRCGSNYGALSFYARNTCEWQGAHLRIVYFQKLKKKSDDALRSAVEYHLVKTEKGEAVASR